MSEPVKNVPAIGYSITANLGGEAQIVFQHFVGEDEADAEVNRRLDRILTFVERLRARGELPDLRKELDKHEVALANFTQDRANIDAQFARDQAMADVQIKQLNEQVAKEFADGERAHKASGRQGSYTPSGRTRANIERIEASIAAVKGEKEKQVAEREAALQNLGNAVQRYEQEIERLKAKIAENEDKLKGD